MTQLKLKRLETFKMLQSQNGLGALSTPQGNLPLKRVEVHTRIAGVIAHITLKQTFKNTLRIPLEATYIFPLPMRAGVHRFTMEVGGRIIEGVLQEREQARREYEQALRQGHRASIAEEERPNVFTIRVGNIMPSEEAHITLEMAMPLEVQDGEVTYQFPLVVAPRYISGIPLDGDSVGDGVVPDTDEVPDASRITPPVLLPGFPNPVQLAFTVEIDPCGATLHDLRCSLHKNATLTETDGIYWIELQPGERLNRDFILRYRIAEEHLKAFAVLSPDEHDPEAGTLMTVITAPRVDTTLTTPRDIVVVLDRSGSMDGWKMECARRATTRIIESFHSQDRFALMVFDNVVELYKPTLEPATDRERHQATMWLANVYARGGTHLRTALHHAFQILSNKREQAVGIIVLVTDGQVGNEGAILHDAQQAEVIIHTVGIDEAVNEALLKLLAERTGGSCALVESEERLDEALDDIRLRLGAPALTDIELNTQGFRIVPDTLLPTAPRVLYQGSTLILLGRYEGTPNSPKIVVTAKDDEGDPWQVELTPEMKAHPALTPVWARAMVRELQERYFQRPNTELEQKIVDLSLAYSVLSRFTAWLAVDRSEIVNPEGRVHRIVQPVELPSGWEMQEEYIEPQPRRSELSSPTLGYIRHDTRGFMTSRYLEALRFTEVKHFTKAPSQPKTPPSRHARYLAKEYSSWVELFSATVRYLFNHYPQAVTRFLLARQLLFRRSQLDTLGGRRTTPLSEWWHLLIDLDTERIRVVLKELSAQFGLSGVQVFVAGESFDF